MNGIKDIRIGAKLVALVALMGGAAAEFGFPHGKHGVPHQ